MRGLWIVAVVGCGSTTNTPRTTEAMPLPGETRGGASIDEPKTIFVIGTDGAVTSAASSGVEPRLSRCIDDVVARRVFPAPSGGTVKVRYPFTFARSGGASSDTAADYRMGVAAPASAPRVTCGRRR